MFPTRNSFYTYDGLVGALKTLPRFRRRGQPGRAHAGNRGLPGKRFRMKTGGLVYIRESNQANWNSYCSSGNCGGKQYYGARPDAAETGTTTTRLPATRWA